MTASSSGSWRLSGDSKQGLFRKPRSCKLSFGTTSCDPLLGVAGFVCHLLGRFCVKVCDGDLVAGPDSAFAIRLPIARKTPTTSAPDSTISISSADLPIDTFRRFSLVYLLGGPYQW